MPTYPDLNSGQVAVTATAQRITSEHDDVGGVIVRANAGNAIDVFIGPSGVTTSNGFRLGPGESVTIGINDQAQVYVIASTTGASVSWLALSPSV